MIEYLSSYVFHIIFYYRLIEKHVLGPTKNSTKENSYELFELFGLVETGHVLDVNDNHKKDAG